LQGNFFAEFMVHIDQISALGLMAQLEGQAWLENQKEATGPFSFAHIYAGYQKLKAKRAAGARNASWAGLIELSPQNHGRSSVNRYFVHASGEISFSRHHETTEEIAKAAELGFAVWPQPHELVCGHCRARFSVPAAAYTA
jgi:hypothetical protein